MNAATKVRTVALSEDLAERLDAVLGGSGRSIDEAVGEAVALYVRNRETYLASIEEGLKSLESGQAHSAESIFAWMRSWGTDDELPPPEPDVDLTK